MRRRVLTAILAVAMVAIVLFALPLAIALKEGYRDDELLKLQRDTVAATRQIDVSAPGSDPVELPGTGDRLAAYGVGGRLVAGQGPPRAPSLLREALKSGRIGESSGGGSLTVAVPLLADERVSGAVLAVRSDEAVSTRARKAWIALAGLAGLIGALATIAALVLSRRLALPLESLAAAARRLGHGDFSVRAPRSGVAEPDAVAKALDGTAKRLGEMLQREREFTADASHQLRNPLAALRLELEALQMRGGHPVEAARALEEVERLQATIEALLSAARDTPRQSGHADLREVVAEAEHRWRGPLAAAGRPLRVSFADPAPVVAASGTVVTEVLQVLLENARRHGRGEVTIAVRNASGSVAVDVGDEGPGFERDPEHLFARRSSGDGGHGIGLSLARSLARSEGGDLAVTHAGPHPRLTLLLPRP